MQNTTPNAFDDAFSLAPGESLTDSVLSNDTDADGNTLTVVAVGGDSNSVNQTVAGSNGGVFSIDEFGNITFDTAGEFDDLGDGDSAVTVLTYTVSDGQTQLDPGSQTDTDTSATVGAENQTGTLTLTTAEFTNDGTTPIDVAITLSDPGQSPILNIVFVVDVSGSTEFTSFPDPNNTLGDENGDGDADDIIDAQIAALKLLSADIAGLGFPAEDVEIALVTFSSGANFVGTFEPAEIQANAPAGSLQAALESLQGGGTTNFEAALQSADEALTQLNQGITGANNIVYFLSDGVPTDAGGTPIPIDNENFSDEAAGLINDFGAEITAIGVGGNSSLPNLNLIDNTVEDGQTAGSSAEQVTTIDALVGALSLSPIVAADLAAFRIEVDGQAVNGIDITDLVRNGFTWDLDISGIDPDVLDNLNSAQGTSSVVTAVATFDDGTELRTDLTIEAPAVTTDTATVTVTVIGVNDPPVAVDDTANTGQNQPIDVDVLSNDSDPNEDSLTVAEVTVDTVGAGTAEINPDGTVRFVPDRDFFGDAQITYTLSDGMATDTAVLTVTVAQNFAPFVQEPVSFEVEENQSLAADLFAIDPEGDALTWSVAGGPDGDLFSIDPDTGRLTFDVLPDFEAPQDVGGDNDYFLTVEVDDGLNTTSAVVQVTVTDVPDSVNEAPNITSPTPVGQTNQAFIGIGLGQTGVITTITAEDPDNDTLEFRLFGEDEALFDLNPITGVLTLQNPVPGPFGSFDNDPLYELIVQVEDGQGGQDTIEIILPLFTAA